MEQRITQQRNDLSLLAANLEYTRTRLDDLLHRFVPEQVADALLADNRQVVPGGIRREVSVLFADLRGFTSWAASREPEVVLTTLNLVFDRVVEILLKNKATLDKFVGDAIMAFFNAPNDQPDHALRALECASQIRDLSLDGLELRFGVGINSGPVVAGNVGTARAMQYTVLGDTVNIAKRLEEQARPSEVLFGAGFAEHVRGKCQYSKIGHMQLKGYSEPLTVYHLH
jgi:adenylate cyclase